MKIKGTATYKLKGDVATNWESNNPILAEREPGLVLDENRQTIGFKVGDGISHWNELPLHSLDENANIDEDRLLSTGVLEYPYKTLNVDEKIKTGVYIVPKNIDIVITKYTDNGDGSGTFENITLTHTYNRTILHVENIQRTGIYGTIELEIVGAYGTSSYFIEYNPNSGILSYRGGPIGLVDQTYNPESEKAQSGLAVEEAISNKANLEAIVLSEPPTIESVIVNSGYEFHRGKFYYNGKYEENGILFDYFIDEKQAQPLYLKFTTEISELFKGCLVEIEFDENEQYNPVILNFIIFKDLSDKADKSVIGDISTALDRIIALQESIMGGE